MDSAVAAKSVSSVASPLSGVERKAKGRRWWHKVRKSPALMIGFLIVLFLALVALTAPLWAPYGSNEMRMTSILVGPSAEHLFGTDDFGRDILSRVAYGTRMSLLVGVSVSFFATSLGIILGSLAGFYDRIDSPIMRVMDVFMAFPAILLAIGIMAVLGQAVTNIIIALTIPYIPRIARVVRGEILQLREEEFVLAARAIGKADGGIMIRHLLPNCLGPILIQLTYILALAILAESGLNFLGVGVPPNVATLGGTLSDARTFLRTAPWMAMFPGIAISLLVLGFNLLGDGLRDVMDPRMEQ
jgi:peptide/nickel transport system permease protein